MLKTSALLLSQIHEVKLSREDLKSIPSTCLRYVAATLMRVEFLILHHFQAIFFGNAGSNLEVSLSCVGAGSAQAAVYASEETSVQTTDNFIDTDYQSLVCPEFGKQLVKERPGAGCFQTNRTDCTFDCETFFEAVECQADSTDSPSAIPSSSPSTSFSPVARSLSPSSAPIDTASLIPTPSPSRVIDRMSVPESTTSPVISLATGAPSQSRVVDDTSIPGSTLSPVIPLATLAPTPSRMIDAMPGSNTLPPVMTSATPFPVVVSPGRDIPVTPSGPTAPVPTTTDQPGTTSTTRSPTLSPSTFLSTLIRPSSNLLVPLPGVPDMGTSPSVQEPSGAQLPTVEPMVVTGAPATSNIPGSQMPARQQTGATPSTPQMVIPHSPGTPVSRTQAPMTGTQPIPSPTPGSQGMAQGSTDGQQSQGTHAPAAISLDTPSATTLPTSFIVSTPSRNPELKPDKSRMPSVPSSGEPNPIEPGSSHQPVLIAPDRQTPSSIEAPTPTTTQDDCDCGKSSKKKKGKSSSKGKSKGENGGNCNCSKGKKSGKGKGSGGKGMKKGYVRHSYQVNHALHDLEDQ